MKKLTKGVMLAAAATLIVYDILAFLEPSDGDTISAISLDGARRFPAIAWGFGALAGHLFWPTATERTARSKWIGFGALLGTFAVLLVASSVLRKVPLAALVVLGVGCGHLLWPQHRKGRSNGAD